MAFTWTELLDSIKVRGMIPTSQQTFTEARLLVLANECLRSELLPDLLKVREEFFSYDVDTAVTADGVYDIHNRAIGSKLENVALIRGTERLDLVQLDEDDVQDTAQPPDGKPGFYLKRNQIIVLPSDGAGYTYLRQTVLLRPTQIVTQGEGAQITAINTGTKTATCTTVPSSWTTANTFELVQQTPHFDSLGFALAATTVTTGASGSIIFTNTLPTRLAVGDWIGLNGQSPVVQVPVEFNPYLAQLVARECLKNSPHAKAYEIADKAVKDMKKDLVALVAPRVEKEGKKLVNRTGMLRRGL